MTNIYLIRHAEAEGNLYRRSQGHYDSNITALGKRQIAALAERFRQANIDALWSSDLHRTQSTAAAILKHHPSLELNLSEKLREIDVSIWEDRPWGNLAEEWPEQMAYFSNDPARWSIPGCEPFTHVADRMQAAVLSLASRYDGKTVAAVTHGLSVRALLARLLGVPSAEINRLPYGDNTAVTLLEVKNDTIRPVWYNDASHLESRGLSTFSRQGWRKAGASGRTEYGVFHPLDPSKDPDLYTRCYENTWLASHGSLQGYVPSVYLNKASVHARHDPECLVRLEFAGRFAGIIELDPDRGAEDSAGWISLIWIEPDMRGKRLGAQLIGHAVSYFRRRGRRTLRLHTADTNLQALGFYEALGFRRIGKDLGAVGELHLMELYIAPSVLRPEDIPSAD